MTGLFKKSSAGLIVGGGTLERAGIAAVLEDCGVKFELFSSTRDIPFEQLENFELLVCLVTEAECVSGELSSVPGFLDISAPRVAIVLDNDWQSKLITCHQDWFGCLPANLPESSLVGAFNTMLSGLKVIHPAFQQRSVAPWAPKSATQSENARRPVEIDRLTSREWEIASILAQGDTNKQIARSLNIRPNTVNAHVSSIMRKLSVTNRTQIAVWCSSKLSGNSLSQLA